jgi:hypothetical protein
VVADLVAGLDHLAQRVRVALGGVARHVEGGLDGRAVEDREDARQPADDAEATLAQRAQLTRRGLGAVEPAGLGVDVEGERDGDLRPARPIRPHPSLAFVTLPIALRGSASR